MATKNISQNLIDNNNNWLALKEALRRKGVDVSTLTTYDYASVVDSFQLASSLNLETKAVQPSTVQQIIEPSPGFDGLESVTVEAVDSNIDTNIIPENIREGVEVLGVVGTLTSGSSSIDLSVLDYFFYKNVRKIADFPSLVSQKSKSMKYAFAEAEFPVGTYTIDLDNINDSTNAFTFSKVKPLGVVDLIFKAPSNNASNALLSLMASESLAPGSVSKYFNVSFGSIGGTNKSLRSLFMNQYLGTVDLTNLASQRTPSIYQLFRGAEVVNNIVGLNGLDLSACTDAGYAFYQLNYNSGRVLESLDVSNILESSSIINLSHLADSSRIKSISLGSASITKQNIECMFGYNNKLETLQGTLDIDQTSECSGYNNSLFINCQKLQSVQSLRPWHLCTNSKSVFDGCAALTSVPEINMHIVGSFKDDFNRFFYACASLVDVTFNIVYDSETLGLSYWDYAFRGCTNLQHVRGNFDMSRAKNFNGVFYGCSSLVSIETTGSFGGHATIKTTSALTLDLSASSVFDANGLIESLASNESGATRNLKFSAVSYSAITEQNRALAVTKKYTLVSA